MARDAAGEIAKLLDELPAAQRRVVVLRDVDDLPSAEVCRVLGITDANQRVLLHRGRAHLHARIERELEA